MIEPNWNDYLFFSRREFVCKCGCNEAYMDPDFMQRLSTLRTMVNFPIIIASGFRCPGHDIEAAKVVPGVHTEGIASDIRCSHTKAYDIVAYAKACGFKGIGVHQRNATSERFIHLDTSVAQPLRPRPHVWSYP